MTNFEYVRSLSVIELADLLANGACPIPDEHPDHSEICRLHGTCDLCWQDWLTAEKENINE